ncbi:MAG: C45 family peptidase [Bdellovibrionia bacterium]
MEHRKIQGIHFIRVKGDLAERMRAHVILLRNEVRFGALQALAKKNEWLIRKGPGLLQSPVIQDLVLSLYKKGLMPYLGSRLDRNVVEAMKIASSEAGLSFEDTRESLFQADAMMILARTSVMRYLLPEWIAQNGLPGCTSAVVLNDWTQNGKMLACRNLDYPIVGPWERNPTVIFNEPSEKGEIPHITLTTAGVHFAGVTAMNQEGLTFFAHAHFGRRVSLTGNPVVMIGDKVIRQAKTLDQAIDIVRKNLPYTNWAFVVSSAKDKQAVVIEATPRTIRVRSAEDGYLAHTNYFHNPELQKEEALLSGGYREDLEGRFCRMEQLLRPLRGQMLPAHMSSALGDHVDYYSGTERVFSNTLSVITTVKSAVFEPENLKFWMASRLESPVALGNFIEVDTNRFWKTTQEEYESSMETLPGYQPKNPRLIPAIQQYREAYLSFHMSRGEPGYEEKSLAALQQAVAILPEDEHLAIQAGLLAFKIKKFDVAYKSLNSTVAGNLTPHAAAVRDLFLARCLDLLGKREEALVIYRKNSSNHEPKLARAFKKAIRRPYKQSEIKSIVVDLHFPDAFEY